MISFHLPGSQTIAFASTRVSSRPWTRRWLVALCAVLAVLLCGGGSMVSAQTANFSSVQTTVGSGFSEPLGVAADAKGDLFVADAENMAIYEIVAVNGSIPASPTIRTLYRPSANPEAIAVDNSGNVYFTTLDVSSNFGNNTVTELLAIDGTVPASPTVRQLGSGLFYPMGVAVDQSGDVFVSDSSHSLVKELLAVNGSIPASPTIVTLGSGFSGPRGIAVDSAGDVYISDFGNKAVKEILSVGGSIPASPTINTLASGFCAPWGLTLDLTGNLYLADYCNAAVFEFHVSDGSMPALPSVTKVASGLSGIEDVAVNSEGIIYAGVVANSIPEIIPLNTNFGAVNVGTQSMVSPLTAVFKTGGTLGSVVVLTSGAEGQDFADTGMGTCTAGSAYSAGQTCTVDVAFTPRFSGTRYGAAVLYDSNGNAIATTYIQGTGVGPQLSFSPGTQTTLGSGFDFASGVALDGSGNAYVIDMINNLGNVQEIMAVKGSIPANPTIKTLIGGLDCPGGPALDAAGNIYFFDVCYHTVNEIQAVGGSIPASPTVKTLTSQFVSPAGIAVDGSGNVYVLDASNNTVNEIFAVNGSIPAVPTITTLASGFKQLNGIAVDNNGNVYVSDDTSREVFEIHAINGSIPASPLITSLGSGFVFPRGIAVDVIGNVYVAEYSYNTVYEILAVNGSIPASPTIQTLGTGLVYANGVAIDGNRNVIVADYGDARIVRLDYADPPSLSFASTTVGSISTDSPQTTTIENVGNAALSFPASSVGSNPSIAADFTLDSSGTSACPLISADSATPGVLAAGASCQLPISFFPTKAGALSGSLVLTDNDLNASAPVFTAQSIMLSGTGTQATPTITWASPAAITYGTPLSATQLNATSTVAGTFTYSPAAGTVLGAGQQALTATFTSTDSTDYTTATATETLTVNPVAPTITWASPAAITYGTLLSPTQLNATSTVAGTFTYSPAAGTILGVGSQTLTVAFTPTDSADYTTAKATVTLTVNPAPSFTIGASPAPLSVTQGANGTSTITVTPLNGFTGSVSLSASGLPSGVTAAFSTNPTTKTSVLTLTASSTAATGLATITVAGTSGSLTATTPITLTVIAKPGFACHVGYTITNHWQGGFGAAITINNTGTTAIKSWTLKWSFANGQTITQIWNGTETQSGANITATSMSYNGSIPAGGSYTGMGFNGSWNNSTNAIPASFSINGTTCK